MSACLFEVLRRKGEADLEDIAKIKRLLTGILIVLLFGVVYFARDMLLPIVIAILISLTLSPIVRTLWRIGVPRAVSAVVLILGASTVLFAGAYMISGPLSAAFSDAPQLADQMRFKLSGLLNSLEQVQNASSQVEELADGADDPGSTEVEIKQPGLVEFAAGSIANFLSLLAVGLVLSIFILASGDLFYAKLVETAPTLSDKRKAVETMRQIERSISHYFLTITAINAGLGVAVAIVMSILGMPLPLLWGVLAFMLNFLPFVGGMAGVVAAAAVGILTYDTLLAGLLPAGLYLILTSVEGQFITPTILGRRLELNTVSVLLTVIIWSWLWSIPGALMAVPFLVFLKVVSENIPAWSSFGNFLSGRSIRNTSQSS